MKAHIRSVSACILLAYVIVHLLNHALALWSLQAADALLALLSGVWRSWPATLLLSAAHLISPRAWVFTLGCGVGAWLGAYVVRTMLTAGGV